MCVWGQRVDRGIAECLGSGGRSGKDRVIPGGLDARVEPVGSSVIPVIPREVSRPDGRPFDRPFWDGPTVRPSRLGHIT